jgi:hypothetical protein
MFWFQKSFDHRSVACYFCALQISHEVAPMAVAQVYD